MKTKRHAKILEIISENAVDTQEELLRLLREQNFAVTQATVSRDIKELRLVKSLAVDGSYRYSVPQAGNEKISSKFHTLFSQAVLHVDYAQNIVIVKCLGGMAQAVCAAMDALHWENVMATLAGDDTFLCITKDEAKAAQLVADLRKLHTAGM
ncbi:MAG: arginine repressor [Clostridia bacterium]|nr:arginine repressor [Clostridia bacterium]